MIGAPVGNGFWAERLGYVSALSGADAVGLLLLEAGGGTSIFGAHNLSAEECQLDPRTLAKVAWDRVPLETEGSLRLADGRSATALCLAPIIVQNQVLGLVVGARADRSWGLIDRRTLVDAAGLIGVDLRESLAFGKAQTASQNLVRDARLERELYREMSTLHDVDAFLEMVPQRLSQRFAADRVSLMLLERNESLVVRSAYGLREDIAKQARPRLGEGIAGWVAQHGEPLLLSGPIHESRFQGIDPSISSAMVAPLRVRDRIIGVVNVKARADAAAFETADLDGLTRFVVDLGVALGREGQLLGGRSDAQRRIDQRAQMHVLFELSRLALFAEPGQNLNTAVALLSDALHEDTVGIWLFDVGRRLRPAASRGYLLRPPDIELGSDPYLEPVVSRGAALAVNDLPEPMPWSVGGVHHYLVAPVVTEAAIQGVFVLGRRASQYEPGDIEFAEVVGIYLGLIVAAREQQIAERSTRSANHLTTELTDVVLTLEVLQRLLRSDSALPERLARAAREAQALLSQMNPRIQKSDS